MSFVGIDLGTSGTRVAAYDQRGRELAARSRPTALDHPGPGLVELDAEEVLAAAVALCAELTADDAVRADPVDALSFAVLGEAIVPVDSGGHALTPTPVSMDRRGAGAVEALGAHLGRAAVHDITGQPLHPMFAVHKIVAGDEAWRGPAVAQYRSVGEFVAGRLGADDAVDRTIAARTGAYDVVRGCWSSEILDHAGLRASDFAPAVDAGTPIGRITASAASATGLRAGTPIVLGAHDQAAAYLGGGGVVGRRSVFSFGSSDCLTVGTPERPAGLETSGFATYPLAPGLWVTLAGTATGGWALEWFADLVRAEGAAAWEELYAVGGLEPPGLLVLPYFAGSGTLDNDPEARAAVVGLTLETTTAQLARAFLEASGFELAKILAALDDRGIGPAPITAVGTGARNPAALHARAAAAGIALGATDVNASCRGAALLAAVGVGAVPSVHELPAPPVHRVAEPDTAHADWYATQRASFAALYDLLKPINHTFTLKEHP